MAKPMYIRAFISLGFAMELWETPLHGKTHTPWLLPQCMTFAIYNGFSHGIPYYALDSRWVEPYVVCFQIACLDWWIVTMITLVRLFSSVCHNVTSQSCSCGCWIITLVALVEFLSAVYQRMRSQMFSSIEWLLAFRTFVQLLSTVSQHVIS